MEFLVLRRGNVNHGKDGCKGVDYFFEMFSYLVMKALPEDPGSLSFGCWKIRWSMKPGL